MKTYQIIGYSLLGVWFIGFFVFSKINPKIDWGYLISGLIMTMIIMAIPSTPNKIGRQK